MGLGPVIRAKLTAPQQRSTKTSRGRQFGGVAMTALIAAGGLAFAAPAHAESTGTVKARTQRMSGPTLESSQDDWYNVGDRLTLTCHTRGQSVQGFYSFNIPDGWDNLWYKVSDGHFVADVDIDTGTLDAIGPDCSVQPATPPSAAAPSGRTTGATSQHNHFVPDYVGYCTFGAQEKVHEHAGYYIPALTGSAGSWDDQARKAGWTVAPDAQARSIVVFESSLVGGVGHVAWVDAVNGKDVTITEMNYGRGATAANGYRTEGFNKWHTRTVKDVPGMSYILIP